MYGIEWDEDVDGARTVRVQGVVLRAEPRPTGWVYRRGTLVGEVEGELPRLVVTTGEQPVLAHLDPPTWLVPGASITTWWAWPLRVEVQVGDGAVLDAVRPAERASMLGPVDAGRVLRAVPCARLAGGRPPPGFGRLRIDLQSRASTAVLVRRVPVDEPALGAFVGDDGVVLSTLEVTVTDGSRAQARVVTGRAPPGGKELRPPKTEDRGGSRVLDWLLDATRRSTEFDL